MNPIDQRRKLLIRSGPSSDQAWRQTVAIIDSLSQYKGSLDYLSNSKSCSILEGIIEQRLREIAGSAVLSQTLKLVDSKHRARLERNIGPISDRLFVPAVQGPSKPKKLIEQTHEVRVRYAALVRQELLKSNTGEHLASRNKAETAVKPNARTHSGGLLNFKSDEEREVGCSQNGKASKVTILSGSSNREFRPSVSQDSLQDAFLNKRCTPSKSINDSFIEVEDMGEISPANQSKEPL